VDGQEGKTEQVDCPIAASCGGCSLIGSAYAAQLAIKTERVRAALSRHGPLAGFPVDPCHAAPRAHGYRNRAKLAVAARDGELRIGLYERGSNRIVDLAPCRVQGARIGEAVRAVRSWIASHRLAAPAGPVIYVDVREAFGGAVHLTVVVDAARCAEAALPYEALDSSPVSIVGVALNLGDARSSYPIGEVTRVVRGAETFEAPVPAEGGETVALEVPATGFFQVSTDSLPFIHATMRKHLGTEEGVLYDLYCGVGVHGLMIARRSVTDGLEVIGIESNATSATAAARNAVRLGVRGRYVASRVEDRLPALLTGRARARVVLNPGRSGCHERVADVLGAAEAAKIAYLSCNPDTLARDLAALVGKGLRLVRVLPIDLMPQTDQVEVLALLEGV